MDDMTVGDFDFTSGRRIMAQTGSRVGQRIFAYIFSDHEATTVTEFAPSQAAPGSLGGTVLCVEILDDIFDICIVPHTGEIPYVFGTLDGVSDRGMDLSMIMQDYWISFVTFLDPNDDHGEKRKIMLH